MRYEAITGLTHGQLIELTARVREEITDVTVPGGRPAVIGLFRSLALVVALMRKNLTQEAAGGIFGCPQSTVSRRWDLIRLAIGAALTNMVPDQAGIPGTGTALVDGSVAPTWDWAAIPDLFSGKAGYPGMNIQVAATLDGRWPPSGRFPSTAPATTRTPSPPLARRICSPG